MIFIEKLDENEDGTYYLLIDFTPHDGENRDEKYFVGEAQIDGGLNEFGSMLEIENLTIERGNPLVDHYYSLPSDFFNLKWSKTSKKESNDVIGYSTKNGSVYGFGVGEPLFNIVEGKYSNESVSLSSEIKGLGLNVNEIDSKLKFRKKEHLEDVYVYNVKQANCNAILTKKTLLIYDFGFMRRKVVRSVLGDLLNKTVFRRYKIARLLNYFNYSNKVLVISHWDTDHYNAIKANVSLLECFDRYVLPEILPTKTSKRHCDLLKPKKIIPIKKGRTDNVNELTNLFSQGGFQLFQGNDNSDRNKSGIVVTFDSSKMKYIFSGDHHFEQITALKDENKDCVLVAPHHGGAAGEFVGNMDGWTNLKKVVFSNGGRFKHPKPNKSRFIDAYPDDLTIIDTNEDDNEYFKL